MACQAAELDAHGAFLLSYHCVLLAKLAIQLLVFAHHKNVLDALQKQLLATTGKASFIRIDGRTLPKVKRISSLCLNMVNQ